MIGRSQRFCYKCRVNKRFTSTAQSVVACVCVGFLGTDRGWPLFCCLHGCFVVMISNLGQSSPKRSIVAEAAKHV